MISYKLILSTAGLAAIAGVAGFDLLYRKRDQNSIAPLTHERTNWEISSDNEKERIYKCTFNFKNHNSRYEGTMVNMKIEHKILFKDEKINEINLETRLIPKNSSVRKDGYIPAFLMPALSTTEVEIEAKFTGDIAKLDKVHAVVLRIYYTVYDRRDYHQEKFNDIIFVPVQEAAQANFSALEEQGATIYPVRTHLLTDGDDLAEVIKKYAGSFLKEGDIVVIAESPIAITEGRFKHPRQIKPGWWARRLCYFVPSAGSLSSPYGMQSAIDQIGTTKFVTAMFAGAAMKAIGKNGWFYTLAGMESELIDDLTGTIPPYDQYIVLGPKDPDKFVSDLKNKIGADVAIADANDLKKARILACTLPSAQDQIRKWMLNNPAGNSTEQTPIVIIRPDNANLKKVKTHDQTCEV
jgi:F420-0:gamma-glutamyl ligase